MEFKPKLLLLVAAFFGMAYSDTSPEIVTNAGTVTGTRSSVTAAGKERKLDTFLGIPYAKAPTGNLRFAKPQPLDNNFGKLEATKLGASCPQITFPPMAAPEVMSEDCLFLNIFVPVGDAEPSGRAVMFFIHGGGFAMGSADLYVSDTLATFGDVIVVTINYRLGLWGFFSTGDENAPGNLALWDQHMALQWVNQNIRSFGGDNSRVTIFGQSAGSTSVFLQTLFPPNRGLFQRAIAESGTASSAYGTYSRDVLGSATIIAEGMNCTIESTKLMVECLRGLEYDTMMEALTMILTDVEKLTKLMFFPGMDNDFIKIDMKDFAKIATMEGIAEIDFFRSLDIISGFNSMEGAFYGGILVENSEEYRPTRETMRSTVSASFDMFLLGHKFPDVVLDLIMSEYTDWNDPENPETLRKQFVKIFGDLLMSIGSIEYLRAHSNTSVDVNSYGYHFTPRPTNSIIAAPTWADGANHGDELGFVFGFDERFIRDTSLSLNVNFTTPTDWEYRLSSVVMSYWTNFAKTGNPNSPMPVEPEWPKYKLGSESYLEIKKDASYAKKYLLARETNFWTNTVPALEDAIKQSHGAASPFTKKMDNACSADGECDEG